MDNIENFTLTIKNVDSEDFETIDVALTEKENICLSGYLDHLKNLHETSIVKNGFTTSIKFKYEEGFGLSFSSLIPSDDEISTFLHKMRMFLLHEEYASYNAVTGIIGRRIKNNNVRQFLKRQRAIYEGKAMSNIFSIRTSDGVATSDSALHDWINAYEYHSDLDKRKKIDNIFKNIGGLNCAKALYLSMLIEKVKAIDSIGDFVKMLMVKNHTFECDSTNNKEPS